MANLIPQDEENFAKTAQEHIFVDPAQYIGDPIIVINLLVRSYLDENLPMPKAEAQRILDYTKRMVEVTKKFVKTVCCWQMLITIAQMILTKLPGHIAFLLQ